MLLPAVVLAPFNWMGISPLVVYNLTLLAAFVASAVAAFLLVRELTGSTPAALVGGVIFAFSAIGSSTSIISSCSSPSGFRWPSCAGTAR